MNVSAKELNQYGFKCYRVFKNLYLVRYYSVKYKKFSPYVLRRLKT